VGDHVRAEGRDSLLLVLHVSACLGRLDVRFLARLTRSLGNSRVSSDYGPTPSPILSIVSTALLRRLRLSVYPSAKTPGLIPSFLRPSSLIPLCLLVRRLRSRPGVDVDARLRLKQPPRRYSARAQDRCDLEVSLPTGASLTLAWCTSMTGFGSRNLDWLGLACALVLLCAFCDSPDACWHQALACGSGATPGTSIFVFSLTYLVRSNTRREKTPNPPNYA
jgi:hypothetical protein